MIEKIDTTNDGRILFDDEPDITYVRNCGIPLVWIVNRYKIAIDCDRDIG